MSAASWREVPLPPRVGPPRLRHLELGLPGCEAPGPTRDSASVWCMEPKAGARKDGGHPVPNAPSTFHAEDSRTFAKGRRGQLVSAGTVEAPRPPPCIPRAPCLSRSLGLSAGCSQKHTRDGGAWEGRAWQSARSPHGRLQTGLEQGQQLILPGNANKPCACSKDRSIGGPGTALPTSGSPNAIPTLSEPPPPPPPRAQPLGEGCVGPGI